MNEKELRDRFPDIFSTLPEGVPAFDVLARKYTQLVNRSALSDEWLRVRYDATDPVNVSAYQHPIGERREPTELWAAILSCQHTAQQNLNYPTLETEERGRKTLYYTIPRNAYMALLESCIQEICREQGISADSFLPHLVGSHRLLQKALKMAKQSQDPTGAALAFLLRFDFMSESEKRESFQRQELFIEYQQEHIEFLSRMHDETVQEFRNVLKRERAYCKWISPKEAKDLVIRLKGLSKSDKENKRDAWRFICNHSRLERNRPVPRIRVRGAYATCKVEYHSLMAAILADSSAKGLTYDGEPVHALLTELKEHNRPKTPREKF